MSHQAPHPQTHGLPFLSLPPLLHVVRYVLLYGRGSQIHHLSPHPPGPGLRKMLPLFSTHGPTSWLPVPIFLKGCTSPGVDSCHPGLSQRCIFSAGAVTPLGLGRCQDTHGLAAAGHLHA